MFFWGAKRCFWGAKRCFFVSRAPHLQGIARVLKQDKNKIVKKTVEKYTYTCAHAVILFACRHVGRLWITFSARIRKHTPYIPRSDQNTQELSNRFSPKPKNLDLSPDRNAGERNRVCDLVLPQNHGSTS